MKKLPFSLAPLLICFTLLAQAPERFQYQTVVRDNSGQVLTNQSVSFQISIHQGTAIGAVVYSETHSGSTNDFGLVTLEIGGGSPVSGTMSAIDWGTEDYFIEIEIDPAGGSSYVSVSTTQLLSVPYALNSRQATDMALNDLTNVGGSPANGEVLKWNGSAWAPAMDEDTDNQTLSINNDQLSISGGNTVSVPAGDITGVTAGTGLTGGGTSGAVTLNAQNSTAMWNADQIQGKAVSSTAPATGEVLKWNGTNWAPASDSAGSDAVWSTNGLSAYYNTGHVGVGTAAPSANLQVDAATGENPLRVRIDGQTKLMVHSNGGTGIGYSTVVPPANGLIVNGSVGIGVSSIPIQTNGLVVGGSVGIGTSTPIGLLHLNQSDPQVGSLMRFTHDNTGGVGGAEIGLNLAKNLVIWNWENTITAIGFGNNFPPALTILSDNNVGLNKSTPDAMFHIKQESQSTGLLLENDTDTDTWSWEIGSNDLFIAFNGANKGYWDDATGNYVALSDATLKKDITYLDRALLPALLEIHPATYRLTQADPTSQKAIGFIAQEVQKVLPEVVRTAEDGKLSINYADFGVLAIKAIQEQQAEIDTLKAQMEEIDALKAEVEALKRLMESE